MTAEAQEVPALQLPASLVCPAAGVAYLEHHAVLPVSLVDDTLVVASWKRPQEIDPHALDDLRLWTGAARVRIVSVHEQEGRRETRRLYGRATITATGVIAGLAVSEASATGIDSLTAVDDPLRLVDEAPVVRLAHLLLVEAIRARASDIHIEQTDGAVTVRYRVDGVLQPAPGPSAEVGSALVSRLKVMAGLDIAERRLPQDGRIALKLQDRAVDVRVSIVPGIHGESVVLRLLDSNRQCATLASLNMPEAVAEQVARALSAAHGMILTTGPTGSGKTTTLYAAIDRLRTGRERIVTVEDPVEYRLSGVTQIAVREAIGLSFAAALRALLRQDPDILMVGEIRDPETAGIAVQAALTGHLVLSTLHTNDAAAALTRLADLGVPSYLIASTVDLVLAQRLVRKVCTECASKSDLTSAEYEWLSQAARPMAPSGPRGITIRRGRGCGVCRGTGYHGRQALFELLAVDETMRGLILERRPASELRASASRTGMPTLEAAGVGLVLEGCTTPEEVLRVVRGIA